MPIKEITSYEYKALMFTMDGKPFKFKGIYKSSEKYDIGNICVFHENDKVLIIFLGGDRGWRQLPKDYYRFVQ